jgi:transcriptional regulator with XRE-family HTH domain
LLGDRLSRLRKENKLRQEDIAKKIGVARTTYAMYEQGKRQPDYHTLREISECYNVSTDFLLYGSDSVHVAGKEVLLTEEELKVFNKIKNQPLLFHKLADAPEKKIKALIRMWEALETAEEDEDEDIIED